MFSRYALVIQHYIIVTRAPNAQETFFRNHALHDAVTSFDDYFRHP
jgi:hypothetical protein